MYLILNVYHSRTSNWRNLGELISLRCLQLQSKCGTMDIQHPTRWKIKGWQIFLNNPCRAEFNSFLPNSDSYFLFASPAKSFLTPVCPETSISEYCFLVIPLQDVSYCLHEELCSLQCHLIILQGSPDSNIETGIFSELYAKLCCWLFFFPQGCRHLSLERKSMGKEWKLANSLGECQAWSPTASEMM